MTDEREQSGLARKFRRGSYGVVCDRGLNPRRPVNEDSFLVIEDACLFAVADGVGGQNAGEVASQTAMEILRHYFSKKVRGDKTRYLEQVVAHINSYLYELSVQEEGLSGMATTLALLLLEPRSALLCHVGDSRIYRFTSGRLYRETIDHSLAEYEHHGGLSILEYAKRNIITRAIGVEAEVKPDFKKISLEPNTSFLLCTDGITRHVSDQELEDILEEESDAQIVCDRLKDMCYERGARDNLAAIMVRLEHVPAHRGRASTESELAESEGEGSLPQHRATPLMRIQVPLVSEPGTRRVQPLMSGEGEAREVRARLGPQPESAASRSVSLKSLPALTITVIGAVAIFIAGIIVGRSDYWQTRPASAPVALSPSHERAHAHFDQGIRNFSRGAYQEAEKDFSEAVNLDRANNVYHHWLGRAEMAAGKHREAAESFLHALELNGPEDNRLFAAAAWQAAGEKARAEELLKMYVESQSRKITEKSP